ncbi:hypothetical protein MUK42_01626 [Musa troglodytarum]|uniref:DUF3741 domain-containing protein n=1 Tax=Musa troglodytarum TaxID=320322 RepID=A0A9E7JU30_9LILI|nr:hypothetical protein MUK42_01626 [Musa troglodytarum]
MGFGESGDVQLLEISGRARRLSYMVGSWFKVADLDGGSKNASRGLPKTKEKAGFSGEGEFVEGGELQGSTRLAALEEEKLCGSRSWRSCGEELKEVIRDSIYGRSLLLNSSEDEKASSSRSLGFHPRSGSNAARYEEGVDRRNPIAASGQPMKMKAPSLIARLMGLEQVPADSIKRKQQQVGAAPEARRSMLQNLERSRRFDMDDEATSSRRGAKQEELGSRKTSGRRVAHESERKEAVISKKTEARWSKKSGMAAASACDGRQKSGLDRKQAQSRRDAKTAAAPVDRAKKTRTASTEPRKQSIAFGTGRPRQPVSRSSTVPASTEKKVAAQKTAKLKTTEQKDGEGITDPCRKAEDASAINVTPAAQPPKQRRLHPRAAVNDHVRDHAEAQQKSWQSKSSSREAWWQRGRKHR